MLATMIKQPAGSFKVTPPPEPSTELTAEDQLVDQALKSRPELLSIDLSMRAAQSQVTSSWLRYAPNVSLFGNIRLTNATGFAGRHDSYAFGAQIDWQLFDGFVRDAQRHQFDAPVSYTHLDVYKRQPRKVSRRFWKSDHRSFGVISRRPQPSFAQGS